MTALSILVVRPPLLSEEDARESAKDVVSNGIISSHNFGLTKTERSLSGKWSSLLWSDPVDLVSSTWDFSKRRLDALSIIMFTHPLARVRLSNCGG